MPAQFADPFAALPWDALTQKGPIPFPALDQLAAALAAHPATVWPRLRQVYEDFWEDAYENGTFECLYVPAIVALAAPNLAAEPARVIAKFLVEELVGAGSAEDATALAALDMATAALGPAALPAALRELEETLDALDFGEGWFHLWIPLDAGLAGASAFEREQAIAFAQRVLARTADGSLDPTAGTVAAIVLTRLRRPGLRPLARPRSPDLLSRGGRPAFPLVPPIPRRPRRPGHRNCLG